MLLFAILILGIAGFVVGAIGKWREDMRREDNGTQFERATADALAHPKSR